VRQEGVAPAKPGRTTPAPPARRSRLRLGLRGAPVADSVRTPLLGATRDGPRRCSPPGPARSRSRPDSCDRPVVALVKLNPASDERALSDMASVQVPPQGKAG